MALTAGSLRVPGGICPRVTNDPDIIPRLTFHRHPASDATAEMPKRGCGKTLQRSPTGETHEFDQFRIHRRAATCPPGACPAGGQSAGSGWRQRWRRYQGSCRRGRFHWQCRSDRRSCL